MGTEILRPQDCLVERFRVSPASFHRRKSYFSYGNGIGFPKTNHHNTTYGCRKPAAVRTDQKKKPQNHHHHNHHHHHHHHQELTNPRRSPSPDDSKASTNPNNLTMGRVTILRRGESLDSIDSKIRKNSNKMVPSNGSDFVVFGTERLGPELPEMLPKQIRLGHPAPDVYAGSAFSVSPSPSALPLPTFFKKQDFKSFDDSATRDLRRLLRLE